MQYDNSCLQNAKPILVVGLVLMLSVVTIMEKAVTLVAEAALPLIQMAVLVIIVLIVILKPVINRVGI
jgi:hypothetical protein